MRNEPIHGQLTSGVTADTAALKTLEFIEKHLAAWRDDPERPAVEREKELNGQLCKFLNVAARKSGFAMVHFHHEEPQGTQHSADFSANPIDDGWIEGRTYTKYTPILVVEGKRLPPPRSDREREYVTSASLKKPGGGVQRFKLGLHEPTRSRAGMVGYVQAKGCPHWFTTINLWVDELAASGDPLWSEKDRLREFEFDARERVSRCESEHSRTSERLRRSA